MAVYTAIHHSLPHIGFANIYHEVSTAETEESTTETNYVSYDICLHCPVSYDAELCIYWINKLSTIIAEAHWNPHRLKKYSIQLHLAFLIDRFSPAAILFRSLIFANFDKYPIALAF